MLYTSNLNLKKPEGTDVVNVQDFNDNADILDVEVAKKASSTHDGRMSKEDKTKLDGIEVNANKYTHPSTHSASIITAGTFQGIVAAQTNTSYSTRQMRNVIISPNAASSASMQNSDIWIQYK